MTLPAREYGDADAQRHFFEQAAERIAHVPGVESAAFVNVLPFSTYNRGGRFVIDGAPAPARGREPAMDYRVVSPGYFGVMQIPVVSGRSFDARDTAGGDQVAIVNQSLARRYFDGADPIGRRVRLGRDRFDGPVDDDRRRRRRRAPRAAHGVAEAGDAVYRSHRRRSR